MFGIQHLLAPLELEQFVSEYRGIKALLVPGDPDKFKDLFGWADITHTLNYSGAGYPAIKLVYEKQALTAEALRMADKWLKRGATLTINYVQHFDPIVERFASALGKDLNTNININSYTSWPSKQGFDIHYDRHDVFIIQLAGTKSWKVFEPTHPHPLEREQAQISDPPISDPYLECEMSSGDLLYVPRGHWHYAVSVTPCIHFTVGLEPRSGIDFLAWLVDELMKEDEFLRQDFPIINAGELGGARDQGSLAHHLKQFKQHLTEVMEDDALMAQFIRYCMTTNIINRRFQLPQYVALDKEIERSTEFVPHPDQKVLFRYDNASHSGTALVRGHVLNLKEVPQDFIEYVFNQTEPVSGETIKKTFPDMKWTKIKKFLLALYDAGVLQVYKKTNNHPLGAE